MGEHVLKILVLILTPFFLLGIFFTFEIRERFKVRDRFIFERCNTAYETLLKLDMHLHQIPEGKSDTGKDCLPLIEEAKLALKPLVYNSPDAAADNPELGGIWQLPSVFKGIKS